MKKLFVFLAAMLYVCSASAQVKIGIEAGANLSRMVGSSSLPSEKKTKTGFQIGITADYELGSHWALMSGVSFIQRHGELELGENYHSTPSQYEGYMRFPKVQTIINYLQVPLKLGYKFHLNQHVHLLPSIGLYAAYGFGAGDCDLTVKDMGVTQWKPLEGKAEEGLKAFRRWDWGTTAGLKMIFNQHYTVSLDYSMGIKKMLKEYGLRNSTYQLSVGYRF